MPYENKSNGDSMWQYRAYEVVLPSFDVEALRRVHDVESIQKLIEDGAVIIDMIPYGCMSYKEHLKEKSRRADEIPTLTNMSQDDERYDRWLAVALKNYDKDLIGLDKKILLNSLKEQLEYISRMTEKSREITFERLTTENELIGYCAGVVKSLKG